MEGGRIQWSAAVGFILALLVSVCDSQVEPRSPQDSLSLSQLPNVDEEFDAYVDSTGLRNDLTAGELSRFKSRFVLAWERDAALKRSDRFKRNRTSKLLEDLQPSVTKKMVADIHKVQQDWTAARWDEDLTVSDAKIRLGYIPDPTIRNVTSIDDMSLLGLATSSNLQAPANFNSRKKFPECSDVISRIHDQGRCGSCWAQSQASSFDVRLCIATKGKYRGPTAWSSAGYVTSCFNMWPINGCQGGNPAFAEMQSSVRGVPTGNEGQGTCFPYFASGDALQHFEAGNQKAPRCPTRCAGPYTRSLRSDRLFAPPGLVVQTPSLNLAKTKVYSLGAIPMTFTVYKDFMAYKSGYYDKTVNDKAGGHAVIMIGWERYRGRDYVLSANSWGPKWGMQGMFKLSSTCCGSNYILVSAVSSRQKALPLPASNPSLPASCAANGCSEVFYPGRACQCNSACKRFGTCCSDYESACKPGGTGGGSCAQYGCRGGYRPSLSCQCTGTCKLFGNCCSDYGSRCDPWARRRRSQRGSCSTYGCNIGFMPGNACQCNRNCVSHNNCCHDFFSTCKIRSAESSSGLEFAETAKITARQFEIRPNWEAAKALRAKRAALAQELESIDLALDKWTKQGQAQAKGDKLGLESMR